MNRFVELLKEHPVPAFVGGIGLFIFLYLIFSRGHSSGSAGVVQVGPSDATQQASIAASVQQATINAEANAQANQLQAQYNSTINGQNLQAQVLLAQEKGSELSTTTAGDVAIQQFQTQANIADTQTQGQVAIEQLAQNANETINEQNQQTQQLQISSAADVNKAQIDAELQTTGIAANLQDSLAQIAANVQNNQIDAQVTQDKLATDLQEQANNLNYNLDTATVNDQFNLNSQYLQDSATLATQQLQTANEQYQANLALINSGEFNKGGNGGANQIAAFQALVTGSAPNPYPAAIASETGGNSLGGILAGFASLFSSVGRGIVGGLAVK